MKWKTCISTAYWIDSKDKVEKEAQLCLGVGADGKEHPQTVSWFDELFLGGIEVFNDQHPVTLLLKGPPGDGKTTLALELCYRLAEKGKTSTYISLESESKQITENLTKFGWKKGDDERRIINEITPESKGEPYCLNVYGSEYTAKWAEDLAQEAIDKQINRVSWVYKCKLLCTFVSLVNLNIKKEKHHIL